MWLSQLQCSQMTKKLLIGDLLIHISIRWTTTTSWLQVANCQKKTRLHLCRKHNLIKGINETRLHAAQRAHFFHYITIYWKKSLPAVSFSSRNRNKSGCHRLHKRRRHGRELLTRANALETRRRRLLWLKRGGSSSHCGQIRQTPVHRCVTVKMQIPRQHRTNVRRKTKTVQKR